MDLRRLVNYGVAFALVAFATPVVNAAEHAHEHGSRAVAKSPAARAYARAMADMHKAMQAPRSGNADIDFVRQMIPHHQGAIDMAKIELAYGCDPAVKDFARWVITAQTQEIWYMQQWLRRRDNGLSSAQAVDYYGPAMAKMHHAMMVRPSGNTDADFVRGMIPHHQGAVDMATVLLSNGIDPDLHDLAHGIQRGQDYEIRWLERWLRHPGELSFPSLSL